MKPDKHHSSGLSAAVPSRVKRFYTAHKLLCWSVSFIVVPVFAVSLVAYSLVLRSLPPTSGTLQVDGLRAPVTITRDGNGVPYIEAQHDSDAFFAMGLVHAQDRLWQLEVQRRVARGETSEIFGRGALSFDVFMRTLGIYESAEASVSALSEDAQEALVAYSAGVNGWISSKPDLPSEFQILGVEPHPWSPVDSVALLKVFALNLGLNFRQELGNLILRNKLDDPELRSLLAGGDSTATARKTEDASAIDLVKLATFAARIEEFWQIRGRVAGSNAWAVDGRLTANGKAILANDPHLGLQLPSMWYAASIEGDRIDAAGMTLVGVPIVVLGRNQKVAWGATNLMADTQDLYFERVKVDDRRRYRHRGEWRDFDSRIESFQVKADFPAVLREALAPVRIQVRRTANGPVISDAVASTGPIISMRWTGGSNTDTSFEAFFQANYADGWRSFEGAMALHVAPALGIVYIDAEDNIGFIAAGKVPIRAHGHGDMPLRGWLAESTWQGFIPYDEMPRIHNPETGYVIAANTRITDRDYPYFISNDWDEPARAERIEYLLMRAIAQGAKLGVEDQMAIQLDLVDTQALMLLPDLLTVRPRNENLRRMRDYLAAWDGNTGRDSIASTIFFTWVYHIRHRLFGDQLDPEWGKPERNLRLQRILRDVPLTAVQVALSNTQWCDNTKTESTETCERTMLDALQDAYVDLTHLLGSDPDEWVWSSAHRALFSHRPFSGIRGLDLIYERRMGTGGSQNSINVAGATFDSNRGFTQSYGAGFRQIMQVDGNTEHHWFVNSTGQSGNVVSRHYDDMIESYVFGEYYGLSAPPAEAVDVLTVTPSHVAELAQSRK